MSDEVEVTNLSRRVAIWSSIESISKGLVISTYVKLTTFDKVPEVTNGEVDSEQFPVKRAVTGCISASTIILLMTSSLLALPTRNTKST